jgi:hypothetical protein
MVGDTGFEPVTSSVSTRSTWLRRVAFWLYALVTVSVCLGQLLGRAPFQTRSSPSFLPSSSVRPGVPVGSASRRAGSSRPGRARRVQVERPTSERPGPGGRGLVAFGARWAAASWRPCFQSARVPGRVALAAGGQFRVVGPEALPAGGLLLRVRATGRPACLCGTAPGVAGLPGSRAGGPGRRRPGPGRRAGGVIRAGREHRDGRMVDASQRCRVRWWPAGRACCGSRFRDTCPGQLAAASRHRLPKLGVRSSRLTDERGRELEHHLKSRTNPENDSRSRPCALTNRSAPRRTHRSTKRHASSPDTTSRDGACSATALCFSLTTENSFRTAEPSTRLPFPARPLRWAETLPTPEFTGRASGP